MESNLASSSLTTIHSSNHDEYMKIDPAACALESLQPIEKEKRIWSWVNFSFLWTSILLSPAVMTTGASLLAYGRDFGIGGIFAVSVLSAFISLACLIGNAFAGSRYGISFSSVCSCKF
eukprot:Pgem_evm1s10958